MKKALLSLLIFSLLIFKVEAQNDLKVEPPFWYAQMPTQHLQIMIHGERIGEQRASIDNNGIKIVNQATDLIPVGSFHPYRIVTKFRNPSDSIGQTENRISNTSL